MPRWRESEFVSESLNAARLSSWAFVGLQLLSLLDPTTQDSFSRLRTSSRLTVTKFSYLFHQFLSDMCSRTEAAAAPSPGRLPVNGGFV